VRLKTGSDLLSPGVIVSMVFDLLSWSRLVTSGREC
jgi:hypothetical protein